MNVGGEIGMDGASLSLSKIAGVLNIARLDGSRRAMFFDCVNRYKIPISKRRNYKTNVILLFVRKKVFLNEPIVTLSENILIAHFLILTTYLWK